MQRVNALSGAFDDQGVYRMEDIVRDYEIDMYGVVNNSIYSSYCQHARHQAFKSIGLDLRGAGEGALALSEQTLKYRSPLVSGDVYEISCWVVKVTAVRAVIAHQIRKQTSDSKIQVVLDVEATVVWLDDKYRPIRIPKSAMDVLTRLAKQYEERS